VTLESALGVPGIHIGDGQGRIVGLHSMERKVQNGIDELKKTIRRAEKALEPAAELKEMLGEAEATLKQIRQFVSSTTLPFVIYVGEVKPDGTVVGLSRDAEKRLYIEGNALNARAAQEEVLKFEAFSPVIVLLQEIRMDERFAWMNQDNIEEESSQSDHQQSHLHPVHASTGVQQIHRASHEANQVRRGGSRSRRRPRCLCHGVLGQGVRSFRADLDETCRLVDRRPGHLFEGPACEQHVAFTAIFLQHLGSSATAWASCHGGMPTPAILARSKHCRHAGGSTTLHA